MGSQEEIKIENDFILYLFQNDGDEMYRIQKPVNQGFIQFHFGLKGKGKFIWTSGAPYEGDFKNDKRSYKAKHYYQY